MPVLGSRGVWMPQDMTRHCFPWCLAYRLFSTGDFFFLRKKKQPGRGASVLELQVNGLSFTLEEK